MAEVKLVAEVGRPTGKAAARKIRRDGKVPAVVYGLGSEAAAVTVPGRELGHILSSPGGSNTLINLDLGGKNELVLARQVQRHPVRHTLVHVDLIRVSRDIAVSAEVPLHLVGEAAGVRDGGLVEQAIFTLSIEAKPAELPAAIEVDISELGIGDRLTVAELKLPRGVVATQDAEELVVHVTQPRGLEIAEEGEAAEGGEGGEGEGGGEG